MRKIIICVILFSGFYFKNNKLYAQLSEPGFPASLIYNLPKVNLPIVTLPYFDNNELIKSDTCAKCGERYGVDAFSNFDFWEKSETKMVENLNEKVEIYRVKIVSPTAEALHVIFSHFQLEDNELLFIYSSNNKDRILGAYSKHNNKSDLVFMSNRIEGNELIIEVNRRPQKRVNKKGILKINNFIHVYKSRIQFGSALDCHQNVICAPWYNDFCNQIRSVVKLLHHESGGFFVCSGAVINNTNNNFDPLILTANHCVKDVDNFNTWTAFFNFQSISCNPSTNGNDLMLLRGIDIVVQDNDWNSCPDIALIRLRDKIPAQYNVYFSGWNRNDWSDLPDDEIGVGIHHPNGDVKKISEGDITNPLFSSCLKVNWSSGYTEGGSSGSPLFVSTKEIVGAFSWSWHKNDKCNHDANFFYSWIKNSWEDLQPHLAQNNEDALTTGGIDPLSACQQIINLNQRFFPGNDWQNKNQITIQAAKQINVSNIAPTVIGNSDFNQFLPQHNSDYIIKAGNKISISPGFGINVPDRFANGQYSNFYTRGSENKVRFQIATCQPYEEDCGVNHENSRIIKPKKSKKEDGNVKPDFLIENSKIKVFPNPTKDYLNIESLPNTKLTTIINFKFIRNKQNIRWRFNKWNVPN
jgi:Trypsin